MMKWLEKNENIFDIMFIVLLFGFLISTSYYSNYDKSSSSLTVKILFFILVGCLVIATGIWIYKIRHAEKTEFDAKQYAKLQAEKDEFTIISGGLSIEGIITQIETFDKDNFYLLSFIAFFILLCGIAYRHLIYAIYMQEHYKKEAEKQLSCPFSPPPKGTTSSTEDSPQNRFAGGTLHIIYDTNEISLIKKIVQEDKNQVSNASKVFLSFSVK